MAFHFVQLACDKRVVSEVSILMQHQASAGMSGKWGELESRVQLIRQIIDLLDRKIAARLRLTVPAYRDLIVNDWWLVGRAAIRARAADVLGTLSCSAELVQSGGCPLVR
jgi:ATP-dependent protease ClpP protease subunit